MKEEDSIFARGAETASEQIFIRPSLSASTYARGTSRIQQRLDIIYCGEAQRCDLS